MFFENIPFGADIEMTLSPYFKLSDGLENFNGTPHKPRDFTTHRSGSSEYLVFSML
jgi:hypothetical protein